MLNLPTCIEGKKQKSALRANTRRVKVKGREMDLTYYYNIYCGAPTNGRGPPDQGVRGCLATALSDTKLHEEI